MYHGTQMNFREWIKLC